MKRKFSDWSGAIVALIVVIVMNGLANAIPLGGQTTGEISDKYPSLFTPAGFTFSIWGIIYLGLLGYVIYQALPGQRNETVFVNVNRWLIINCLANSIWILVWHYDFLVLSVIVMALILISLILIYINLRKEPCETYGMLFFVRLPFSIYLGWIMVASIANISVIQTGFGWDNVGMHAVDWTLLKLSLAAAIGVIMILRFYDIAFLVVIGWAAYGISVKQIETPIVAGGAKIVLGIALILAAYETLRQIHKRSALNTGLE